MSNKAESANKNVVDKSLDAFLPQGMSGDATELLIHIFHTTELNGKRLPAYEG